MFKVSNLYKKAVYAPERKTSAQVEFQILNNEAYGKVTSIEAPSQAPQSRANQVVNKRRAMSKKYATFERSYWRMDGSFCILPKPTQNTNSEVGWWSDVIAYDNATYAENPFLKIKLAESIDSIGLTISFDQMTNEYPVDFYIEFLKGEGKVHLESVTGNTLPTYIYPTPIAQYDTVIVTIKKWCRGNRRARITEIDFGTIQVYDGNKLMSVSLLEEMNVVGDTLPSNEIRFTIDNTDKTFNILNPQGYYRFLEKNQEVSLSIGLEVVPGTYEYVNIRRYYLTDWQSDEGTSTATFTARDFLDALETTDYISLANTNLYALAEDILLKAGITAYNIDPGLQAIPTQGFKSKISSRKALQCIGIAGMAAVYQDRDSGVPTIRRFAEIDTRTTFLNFAGEPDMISGKQTYVYADGDYLMKGIDFDNAYKVPQIKLADSVQNVDMAVTVYQEDKFDQVLNTTMTVKGTVTVFFEYQSPVTASSAMLNLTGATSYTLLKRYDSGMDVSITADGEVIIVISGKVLADTVTVYRLGNNTIKEGVTLLIENPLINTAEHALTVGKWISSEFAARAEYSINWRQNPALECGDIVLVEDIFGHKKQSRITKQEYNYAGYLGGNSSTKGSV